MIKMLDKKDLRIIGILRQDARKPIREIAKEANLRPSTVHQRIKKLKQNRTIERFTIKLNNKAIGENFIVFMLVSTKRDLTPSFLSNPHIKEVFGITGQYDLILKLKFKDVEEFNRFVLKFRKDITVKETLTMVVTTDLKEEL
jgi:DNA-binding Lrp family transcriptional regulator